MSEINPTKHFSYVAIGNLIGTVLQAAFYLVFAALLTPQSYGELTYMIALAGTVSLFARFGLSQTVTVFHAKKNHTLANQVNTLAIITSTVAALVLIPINEFVALLSLALSFFAMNQSNLLGLQKYKKQMYVIIAKNACLIVFAFLFYFLMGITGILIGMAIGNFIAGFDFLKNLNIKIKSFSDLTNYRKVMVNNFGVDVSSNLSRMIDRLFVAPLFGFLTVGIYQFNMQILFSLEMLPVILYLFILPEEASGRSHKKINYFVIFGSCIFVIITIIFSPIVIKHFFPQYYDGVYSLQILVITLIPLSISYLFSAKLQANESTKIGMAAILRIGTLLALIVVLGKFYGLVGLSIAVLLSTILYMVSLLILYYRSKH